MTKAATTISEKDLVEWESQADGLKTGSVRWITRSLENGQAFAIVEVEHELPGILESIPVDQLRKSKFGKPHQEAAK